MSDPLLGTSALTATITETGAREYDDRGFDCVPVTITYSDGQVIDDVHYWGPEVPGDHDEGMVFARESRQEYIGDEVRVTDVDFSVVSLRND